MALKTKSISKRENGTYIITVEEDTLQIGTDDLGKPIYKTFTVIHNPKDADSTLKTKIENAIKKYKTRESELNTAKSRIDTLLASIDYSKL